MASARRAGRRRHAAEPRGPAAVAGMHLAQGPHGHTERCQTGALRVARQNSDGGSSETLPLPTHVRWAPATCMKRCTERRLVLFATHHPVVGCRRLPLGTTPGRCGWTAAFPGRLQYYSGRVALNCSIRADPGSRAAPLASLQECREGQRSEINRPSMKSDSLSPESKRINGPILGVHATLANARSLWGRSALCDAAAWHPTYLSRSDEPLMLTSACTESGDTYSIFAPFTANEDVKELLVDANAARNAASHPLGIKMYSDGSTYSTSYSGYCKERRWVHCGPRCRCAYYRHHCCLYNRRASSRSLPPSHVLLRVPAWSQRIRCQGKGPPSCCGRPSRVRTISSSSFLPLQSHRRMKADQTWEQLEDRVHGTEELWKGIRLGSWCLRLRLTKRIRLLPRAPFANSVPVVRRCIPVVCTIPYVPGDPICEELDKARRQAVLCSQ